MMKLMIWRLFSTASGLALGYGAVLMSRCTAVGFVWPPEGELWTCLDSAGPDTIPGVYATSAAAGVAVLLVVCAWVPVIVRRRRARKIRANAETSLGANLHRVAEIESDLAEVR